MADHTVVRVPVLHTARLRLDAPTEADFEGYAAIVCGPRGAWVGGPLSRRAAWLDFSQMAAGWVLRGYGALSIRARGTGAWRGLVLVHHERGDPEPELGWLVAEAAEGRGVAREAGEAMLAWAWRATGLPALASYVAPDNARAIRLALRLGGREVEGPPGVLTFRYERPA